MEFQSGRFPRAVLFCALLIVTLAPARAAAQVTSYLFVPNFTGDNLHVIETISRAVLAGTPIALNNGPTGTAAMPDGSRVYISNILADVVIPVDVATLTAGTPIAVGDGPFGLALLPDGSKLYVANLTAGTVSVINTATNAVTATIPAGVQPSAVAVSADGQRVYVSNGGWHTVTVIDATTDAVVGLPLEVGNSASGLAVSPDGARLYVTHLTLDTLTVHDAASGNLITTIPVGGSPITVELSPDGSQAAVANSSGDSVTLVDTATNIAAPAITGIDGAFALSYTPDGATIFVSAQDGDAVRVITAATGALSPTAIAVGDGPRGNGKSLTPPILTTTCTGCGALSIASDADLEALGVRSHVIFMNGLLSLTGPWTTTRHLSILQGNGFIDTHAFDATISGNIVNSGALVKNGTGTLRLSGTATHGGTSVLQGALIVNGTHLPALALQAGTTLGGTGTVGTITADADETLAPGDGGPGILHASAATFATGSQLVVQLNGPAPGTGYDRLDVSGITTLNTPTLTVQLGYTPTPGQAFIIATHVTGTFLGLAENARIDAGGGRILRITYHAGGGSDAALIADAPPTISAFSDQTAVNGSPVPPMPFTVADDLTPLAALGITATSSNQAVVADAGLALGGSGTDRTLTVTPVSGAVGVTTITVTVSDGFPPTTTRQFTLTVQPRVYHLAEGATGSFFSTDLLLANPNDTAAPIEMTFLKDDRTTVVQTMTLPATSRTTIHVSDIVGLEAVAFSTSVTSLSGAPLIVERTMIWDAAAYGAHTEKASPAAAPQWYFAEGSQGFFHTYFLLLNPNAVDTIAHVTYLLEGSPSIQRDYAVAARSRRTIDAGADADLVNRSFGAVVTFDHAGMAERAMYFGEAPFFSGGHASAGVPAPSASWFLAEGATGSYFDTFVLIANPNDTAANVELTYLPSTGVPVAKTHAVPGHQRLTINIATEDPALASSAVSTQATANQPVIVERVQYWPHPAWYESHSSAGEISAGLKWGLAEGRVGGTNHAQTYILIANPGTQAATVTATFLRTNGTTVVKTFTVAATSRFNIAVTGAGSDVPELIDESFGTVIGSTQPVIVERALYLDAGGVTWAAGTSATATRLP